MRASLSSSLSRPALHKQATDGADSVQNCTRGGLGEWGESRRRRCCRFPTGRAEEAGARWRSVAWADEMGKE